MTGIHRSIIVLSTCIHIPTCCILAQVGFKRYMYEVPTMLYTFLGICKPRKHRGLQIFMQMNTDVTFPYKYSVINITE